MLFFAYDPILCDTAAFIKYMTIIYLSFIITFLEINHQYKIKITALNGGIIRVFYLFILVAANDIPVI